MGCEVDRSKLTFKINNVTVSVLAQYREHREELKHVLTIKQRNGQIFPIALLHQTSFPIVFPGKTFKGQEEVDDACVNTWT